MKKDIQELSYGIIQEFGNGTTLWYEPINNELYGFVLRRSGGNIQSVYSENREAYILNENDPNVLAIYEPRQNGRKEQ